MSERQAFAEQYRARLFAALERLDLVDVERALDVFEQAWVQDRLVLLAGNGGSAATAEHMDLDLSKTVARVAGAGKGFRTVALTHGPALSAWANDAGVDEVFAGQVRDLGRRGDVLVVFSAMGNSPNIVAALREATALGLHTIAFVGAGGGCARELAEVAITVDSNDYGVIEDSHLALNHLVTEYFGDWVAERDRTA